VKKNSSENRDLETKLPIHPVICGKPQQQKVREKKKEKNSGNLGNALLTQTYKESPYPLG
jgi:hypothetical protein